MAEPRLDPEALDDLDALEMLSDIQEGQAAKVPAFMRRVLGAEGYEALNAQLAVDGRTKASDMLTWLSEQGQAKN